MKFSKTPTDKILVKGKVDSEWDSCDAAVLELYSNTVENIKKRVEGVKVLQALDSQAYFATFWDDVDWISIDEMDSDIEKAFEEKGWCYITTEEDEEFSKPEQQIDVIYMKVFPNGNFRFSGLGEHTAENFWTNDINIEDLK